MLNLSSFRFAGGDQLIRSNVIVRFKVGMPSIEESRAHRSIHRSGIGAERQGSEGLLKENVVTRWNGAQQPPNNSIRRLGPEHRNDRAFGELSVGLEHS